MEPFSPTHVIVFTPQGGRPQRTKVQLVDGIAYALAEWRSGESADWTRDEDGSWLFQGRAAPSNGTVEVRGVAHRPRQDPTAARVVKPLRVHPDTARLLDAEAKRTGESVGQVVDRLAQHLK